MEKITLKLSEFYQLEAELNGLSNQSTGEVISKGLLSEKIKLTTKYWLHDLNKKVAAENILRATTGRNGRAAIIYSRPFTTC